MALFTMPSDLKTEMKVKCHPGGMNLVYPSYGLEPWTVAPYDKFKPGLHRALVETHTKH